MPQSHILTTLKEAFLPLMLGVMAHSCGRDEKVDVCQALGVLSRAIFQGQLQNISFLPLP